MVFDWLLPARMLVAEWQSSAASTCLVSKLIELRTNWTKLTLMNPPWPPKPGGFTRPLPGFLNLPVVVLGCCCCCCCCGRWGEAKGPCRDESILTTTLKTFYGCSSPESKSHLIGKATLAPFAWAQKIARLAAFGTGLPSSRRHANGGEIRGNGEPRRREPMGKDVGAFGVGKTVEIQTYIPITRCFSVLS